MSVPVGGKVCDNSLKMIVSDVEYCGDCGNKCAGEQRCNNGKCFCNNIALSACSNGCFNLSNDRNNCGKCGNVCPQEVNCSSGVCFIPQGGKVCDNVLRMINTDVGNCGVCGKKCVKGQNCINGKCECTDNSQSAGSDSCFNLTNDRNNCGTCGNVCPQGVNCNSGIYINVPAGGKVCISVVKMIMTDQENCGDCGRKCSTNQRCNNGTCVCILNNTRPTASTGWAIGRYREFRVPDNAPCTQRVLNRVTIRSGDWMDRIEFTFIQNCTDLWETHTYGGTGGMQRPTINIGIAGLNGDILSIEVFRRSDRQTISGISFNFKNGRIEELGRTSSDVRTITISPGERIGGVYGYGDVFVRDIGFFLYS